MDNLHKKISDSQTELQCTPLKLDYNETTNVHCARLCQTEIALVPSSPLTDLYKIMPYIDQEKINEDALRIIDIPQNTKRRFMLPVSKFGLTNCSKSDDDNLNLTEEFFNTSTEETNDMKTKTEDMSSQTDLMIAPHIIDEEEKAVVSTNASCQTFISCSLTNIVPQVKNCFENYDEQTELYKSATEILTEIVHNVISIHHRIFEPTPSIIIPVHVKMDSTSCSADNSEWETVTSDGNSSHSQIKDNSEDGTDNIPDLLVDCSGKENIIYCRSDDNISVASTGSEISSMTSLNCTMTTMEKDLSVFAETTGSGTAVGVENNQSVDLSID